MLEQARDQIIIYKGRTNIVLLAVGRDVSTSVISGEIRKEKNRESDLIATWVVGFVNTGADGELILTIDDSETDELEESRGWTDFKEVVSGEPMMLFDEPLEVLIKDPVTA